MDKEKKYALVTGGGRGIGRAIALRLGEEGYNVALTYRNSKEGAAEVKERLLAMGSKTEIFYADTSDISQINAAFDEYEKFCPQIDLLVNNAGVTLGSTFLKTTPELFETVINTDLRGVFFMAQRAAKYMIKQNSEGCIINIASNQGSANFYGNSAYGSAKAAVIKLTRHMALELSEYNIRVNVISPGLVDSGGWAKRAEADEKGRHTNKFKAAIPLGSWASPEQIAGIAAFLASDDAVYITGEEIIADGGARLPVLMDLSPDWIPEEAVKNKPKSILVKNREEKNK